MTVFILFALAVNNTLTPVTGTQWKDVRLCQIEQAEYATPNTKTVCLAVSEK